MSGGEEDNVATAYQRTTLTVDNVSVVVVSLCDRHQGYVESGESTTALFVLLHTFLDLTCITSNIFILRVLPQTSLIVSSVNIAVVVVDVVVVGCSGCRM